MLPLRQDKSSWLLRALEIGMSCFTARTETHRDYFVHVGKIMKIKLLFFGNFVKCFLNWCKQLFLNPGLNYRHFINDVIEVFKWVQGNCSTKRLNCVIVLLMIVILLNRQYIGTELGLFWSFFFLFKDKHMSKPRNLLFWGCLNKTNLLSLVQVSLEKRG